MAKVIWSTLRCPCCKEDDTDARLKADAELLANVLGADLKCTSGYRCKKHNAALKARGLPASATSRHLFGAALDLCPTGNVTATRLWETAQKLKKEKKFAFVKGIGRYKWGVHIDDKARDFDYR